MIELEKSSLNYTFIEPAGNLLMIDSPLKVLCCVSKEYLQAKISKLDLNAHVTDRLFKFVD